MSKKTLLLSLPFILGLALLLVTLIDLHQFELKTIVVQDMLKREIPIVILGFLVSLAALISSVYWMAKKEWLATLQAVLGPVFFALCFGIGGALGSAYINAT